MKTPEIFYLANYLGVIGLEQYEIFGHFFQRDGLARVERRLPFIIEKAVDRSALLSLDRAIKNSIGPEEFVSNTRTAAGLEKTYLRSWSRFQGAVVEILCEDYLDFRGVGRIVSNEELYLSCARLKGVEPKLKVADGVNVKFNGVSYACPDGLGIDTKSQPSVHTIYEYKSITGGDEDHTRQATRSRQLFGDLNFRGFLQIGLANILSTQPFDVQLPTARTIRTVVVSAQELVLGTSPVDLYDTHLSIGLSNARSAAYFILKCIIGDVPEYSNWENYFQRIDAKIAMVIGAIRG